MQWIEALITFRLSAALSASRSIGTKKKPQADDDIQAPELHVLKTVD